MDESTRAPVYVIGSLNTDLVVKTGQLPAPGQTVLGGDFFMNPGGKGGNQAVAAARLGASVSLVARLGTDIFADAAMASLERDGEEAERVEPRLVIDATYEGDLMAAADPLPALVLGASGSPLPPVPPLAGIHCKGFYLRNQRMP